MWMVASDFLKSPIYFFALKISVLLLTKARLKNVVSGYRSNGMSKIDQHGTLCSSSPEEKCRSSYSFQIRFFLATLTDKTYQRLCGETW